MAAANLWLEKAAAAAAKSRSDLDICRIRQIHSKRFQIIRSLSESLGHVKGTSYYHVEAGPPHKGRAIKGLVV